MFKGRLNLLLKLNLFMLMLLFKEFSDCVHSNSARMELVAPTDAQCPGVSLCMTWYHSAFLLERAWNVFLGPSTHTEYCTLQLIPVLRYIHIISQLHSLDSINISGIMSWVLHWLLCPSWSCLNCPEVVWQLSVTEPHHLGSCVSAEIPVGSVRASPLSQCCPG